MDQKQLWEKLAKENSRYYINSDKGRGITEEQFRASGAQTYLKYVADDKLISSRGVILDYGCGTGRLMEFMSDDFNKVIGVDISPTMIAEGKERLSGLTNVEFLETDGGSLPLPDESVDLVFSYLVFQHIKTREMVEAAFAEIFRVLKPDGIFKVLMRSDKQKDMNRWWSGIDYDEGAIKKVYEPVGFKFVQKTSQDKFAYWLWLQK